MQVADNYCNARPTAGKTAGNFCLCSILCRLLKTFVGRWRMSITVPWVKQLYDGSLLERVHAGEPVRDLIVWTGGTDAMRAVMDSMPPRTFRQGQTWSGSGNSEHRALRLRGNRNI
jgi:hypothetical protein